MTRNPSAVLPATVFAPFVAKLAGMRSISGEIIDFLARLPHSIKNADSGRIIVKERSSSQSCHILVAGYACRHKLNVRGFRQIVSFLIPGDIVDHQSLHLPIADHNVEALTDAIFIEVAKDDLNRFLADFPIVAEALVQDLFRESSIYREWILNVGRRNAHQRTAHMLCEFLYLHPLVRKVGANGFVIPLTQIHFADATGITPIHVNRMIRNLMESRVLSRDCGKLIVLDWEGLQKIGEFNPRYLHF